MRPDVATLFRAAATGDLQTVRAALVHEPALADTAGPHPFWGGRPTALTLAAEWGRIDVLRFLLEYGADADGRAAEYDGWSPLLCAISNGHEDAVSLLLEHGAGRDAFAAAALGDAVRLAAILRDDPDAATRTGPNRATPLHFAANAAVARLLVEAGADISAKDQYGSTPLRCVAYAGAARRGAARFLTTATPEMDIFIATALGDAAAVRAMLEREPGLLEARDEALGPASARGGTALHIAAALGEVEVARTLVERGADPDFPSVDGHAPLHYAARNGHAGMVRVLLESGATVDLPDAELGATPEDWADFFGHTEVESILRAARG